MNRQWVCPHCDALNPLSVRFCHACGSSQPQAPGEVAAASHEPSYPAGTSSVVQQGATSGPAGSPNFQIQPPWSLPPGYPPPPPYAQGTGPGYAPWVLARYAHPRLYGYYGPYGYAAVRVPLVPRREPLAIASLVLGILSFGFCCFLGIPAIALGVAALLKISRARDNVTGSGLAMAGIATGALSTLAMATLVALFINNPSPP